MGNLYILYFIFVVFIVRATSDGCPGTCPPGKEPSGVCTPPPQCRKCPSGYFNDGNLRFDQRCENWKTCISDHMIVVSEGTATQDVICGCEEGYELSGSVHACYKKSVVEITTDTAVNTTAAGQLPIPPTTEVNLVPILVPLAIVIVCVIGLGFYANRKWNLRDKVRRLCSSSVPGMNNGGTELVSQGSDESPATGEIPGENQDGSETSPLRGLDEEETNSTAAPHYRRTRTAPILNQTPLAFTRILCPMSGRHAKKQPRAFQGAFPQPPVNGTSTGSSATECNSVPSVVQVQSKDVAPPHKNSAPTSNQTPSLPQLVRPSSTKHAKRQPDLNLDKLFRDNMIVFKNSLNIDADLKIHICSAKVITPEMLDILQNLTDDEKVLNLMTKQLPKRSRHSKAMFLKCLIETDQTHILEEIGLTPEDIDYFRNYKAGRKMPPRFQTE